MADMMTPQEIQDIFERYNEALRKNVPISESLAKEMADATKGVHGYTKSLNDSIKSLGTSFKVLSKDINNGARGAAVFNDSLESGADVVSKLLSSFGILGMAVGGVVKLFTAFVGAANKQSDALYKSYQDISRAGAAGKEGLTGVYGSMKQFGYTLDQLNDMGALLKENSKSFGLFTSSALAGAKQFGNVADSIQNSPLRKQLFNLGMTVDDINRGIAGYMVQEGKLGKLRGQSQAEVSKGASAYIREMEILTRLTGQNRQELEDQRENAMQIDAFYAGLKELPEEARKEALKAFNLASSVSKEAAAEFAANFNGVITGTTDLLMSTQGESLKYNAEFFKAGGKATDMMQGLGDAAERNQQVTDNLAKIGVKFGLSSRDSTMLTGKAADGFGKSIADVTGDVDAAAAGYDKATNAQSAMRDSQIKSAQSMQDFVNLGVTPVTRAMQALASAVESLTSLLPGSKPTTGYGQGGTGTLGKSLASTGAGAAAGAATGAAIGSVVPGLGTAIGGAVGGVVGGVAGYMGYEFGGGGGLTGKPTTGLEPDFLEKLQRAAGEYQQLTGQPINIVSAKRTTEEQAKLYADFQSGKSRFPAAPPGQSRHESGRAVDVSLETANKLDSMGLLSKYGLSRPVPNDPIHIQGQGGFRGMLSGPMSGYKPNITMHGNEELSIRPNAASVGSGASGAGASEGAMLKLIERVDDLIYLSRNQLGVNEKILRYQQ
jgi:hypothetical protein